MRKLILGCLYVLVCGFLGYVGIEQGSDLLALATVFGAIAVGVGTIVWGNVKEHEAKSAAVDGSNPHGS